MQTNHYIIPSRYSSTRYQRRINNDLKVVEEYVSSMIDGYLDNCGSYHNLPTYCTEFVRDHVRVECYYTPGIPKDLMEDDIYPGPEVFVDITFDANFKYPYYLGKSLNLMYGFNKDKGSLRDVFVYYPEIDENNQRQQDIDRLATWLLDRIENKQNRIFCKIRSVVDSYIKEFNKDIRKQNIHL